MFKWIFASLLFFLLVIELVFFAPHPGDREQSLEEGGGEPEIAKDLEQVLSNIHLVESQGEKKHWELEAEEARKKRRSTDWDLDTVVVHFFGENSVSYKAVGKEGFVGENQKKLRVDGDIVINSSNGYILNTEVIYFKIDPKTNVRTIDGPEHVKLKGPPEESGDGGPLYMWADKFDANLNTNIINLRNNVRGRKRMSGGRKMNITSQEAQFSGQSKVAIFRKDVVIDVDSMTVTGPRAKFVYKNNELHTMFIDGGVKIKDIGKWGIAGEAEVFFQEDKFIFRDSPKVIQGSDHLVGDEIILYDGGDRVQVRKAKTKYNVKENQESGP